MPGKPEPLFASGRIVATLKALQVLRSEGVDLHHLLDRHFAGDWGELDCDACRANEVSVVLGAWIISSYALPSGGRVWVTTEADRSYTCILLPEEY